MAPNIYDATFQTFFYHFLFYHEYKIDAEIIQGIKYNDQKVINPSTNLIEKFTGAKS